MEKLTYITLRDDPTMVEPASRWFNQKWHVPTESYQQCMLDYIKHATEYGWYLCITENKKIVAGLGVIENDFHPRNDLTPNICAVYTEEDYRNHGIAGHLLDIAVNDLKDHDISPVYLLTDHVGFYERYGWKFYETVIANGDTTPSRIYIHE